MPIRIVVDPFDIFRGEADTIVDVTNALELRVEFEKVRREFDEGKEHSVTLRVMTRGVSIPKDIAAMVSAVIDKGPDSLPEPLSVTCISFSWI